jgi:glycosyltransferase 2 family protein
MVAGAEPGPARRPDERTLNGWLRRAIAWGRVVYYPLALALVGVIAYQAARRVDFSTMHYWALGLAYVAALVWWLALAFGWSALLGGEQRVEQAAVWCKTQVARYLPGGIWAPVARATTVQGRVRDKVAAVGAENVIVLCVAIGVGAAWSSVHNPYWIPAILIIALPLAGSRWLERRTRVTHRGAVTAGLTYTGGYVAYGVAGLLTQVAVSGVHNPTYPLYVAGASCIAWAIGLVVVIAPGGVGVREVVYVWMLSGLYPKAELKGAAIAARVVTVLAELTVLAAVWVAEKRRGQQIEVDLDTPPIGTVTEMPATEPAVGRLS